MSRIVLLILINLGSLPLGAQVVITNGDLPQAGDLLRYSIPDTFPSYASVVASSGTNVTWDYGFLEAIAQRKDSFVATSAIPASIRFFFPLSANLALFLETPDSVGDFTISSGYQVFQVSAGAYINHGIGTDLGGIPLSLRNTPSDTIFTLPLAMSDSGSSISSATLSIPGLVYIRQDRKRTWQVDGEGQLETPFGSFAALRVRTYITGEDSIVFDTLNVGGPAMPEELYEWYSPDYPGPLLSISVAGLDSSIQFVSNISYADSLRDVFQIQLSADKPAPQRATIYPNPNAGAFQIDFPAALRPDATLKVFSLDGQLVWVQDLSPSSSSIQLPSLPRGLYQVLVESGEERFQGRLVLE